MRKFLHTRDLPCKAGRVSGYALQSCDLFAAEKAAHSAVFNQFCELIIREVE